MLIPPRRRTAQPQSFAPLDRSNPLGSRVIVHFPLRDASPTLRGDRLTVGGTFAAGYKGQALKSDGATASASVPLDLSGYARLSFAASFNWPVYANTDLLAAELTPNYGSNPGGFIIDPNDAGGAFVVGVSSSPGLSAYSIPRPVALAWHRLLFTVDFGVSQALGAIYVDGIRQTLTAIDTSYVGGTQAGFANSTLYLLSRAGASLFAPSLALIQDFTIYRGVLSDSEAMADATNPWQIFQGRRAFATLADTLMGQACL